MGYEMRYLSVFKCRYHTSVFKFRWFGILVWFEIFIPNCTNMSYYLTGGMPTYVVNSMNLRWIHCFDELTAF